MRTAPGQYVNTSDVAQCATALNGVVTTQITASATATGSSACDGGTCSGQESVKGKVSCAVAPGGNSNGLFWAGVVGLIAGARRRMRRVRG
jgi:MYXO-CTERM domain-containing protein